MNINIDGSFTSQVTPPSTQDLPSLESRPERKVENISPKTVSEFNEQNKEEIKKNLEKVVENLNSQMDLLGTDLKFGYNDKINIMYVNVHERSSGKLIRKFPTDEAMKLAEHMKEFVGMLFDKKG